MTTLYRLRMANRDEYVIQTDPRLLTGDWAIVDRLIEIMGDRRGEWLGWTVDRTIHIRPASIVSYEMFDDKVMRS